MFKRYDPASRADQVIEALPTAIRRLREHAGAATLREAETRIKETTGKSVSRATMSQWESGGRTPQMNLMIVFLTGLGYEIMDLQRAIDDVTRTSETDRAVVLVKELRKDPEMKKKIREMVASGVAPDADKERHPGPADEMLKFLDGLGGDHDGDANGEPDDDES